MTTHEINNTISANKHNPEVVTDDINDGFHTFGQLYFQRMMLFATLVNLFPEISWKSKRHEDGEECFGGGWFLVTIDTPAGAYGYHYRLEDWDKFNCRELYKAKHWDGYTEDNVDRLFSLGNYKEHMQKEIEQNPNLDPFNPNEWCEKIVREVNETEEAFIFSTIKPFIDSITTIEISKEELIRAIHLVRMQREASDRFGVLISSDWDTATAQMHDLNEAFKRGFEAGTKKERDKIKEILDD